MKRLVTALGLLSISLTTFAADKTQVIQRNESCAFERKSVEIMNNNIQSAEKEIAWLRANRGTMVVNGIAGLVGTGAAVLLASTEHTGALSAQKVLTAGLVVTNIGTSIYNFKASSEQIDQYNKLVEASKILLKEQEDRISQNACLENVENGKKADLENSLEKLQKSQAVLAQASRDLSENIGSTVNKGLTVVSISAQVASVGLIIADYSGHSSYGGRGMSVLLLSGLYGSVGVAGSLANAVNLHLSQNEARELLKVLNQAQQDVLKQEQVVISLIKAEKLLQ